MKCFRILAVAALLAICSAGLAQTFYVPKTKIFGKEYYCYSADKGGSLYAVAKNCGWDQSLLNRLNPKLESPFKKDVKIYYPVDPAEFENQNPPQKTAQGKSPIKYKVKESDTLFSLARRYNTTVADIMRENPGVSDKNFKAGSTVTITPGTAFATSVKQDVKLVTLLSVESYLVGKKDTWQKIAKKFRVDETLLKEANPEVTEPQPDSFIVIPNVTVATEKRDVPVVDPRENSSQGRQEIYEQVNQELAEQKARSNVRAALVLDDANSNKDLEFSRGFLKGVDDLKNGDFKISLKIIDGGADQQEILSQLQAFEPTVIFVTADKDFPSYIADYGHRKGVPVVNSFDTKNTYYQGNPEIVQILAPSSLFNENIGKFVADRFSGHTLYIAGEPDLDDAMGRAVVNALDAEKVVSIAIDEVQDLDVAPGEKYLIYCSPTRREEVKDLLERVEKLKEKEPEATVEVFGRPSWITLPLAELFNSTEVYIPSRFYFDPELSGSRKFIDEYKDLYGRTPLKSYPVYAVSGYDLCRYFLQGLHEVAPDFRNLETETVDFEPLQNDFRFSDACLGGGLLNKAVYVLKYNPFGNIDKIIVE